MGATGKYSDKELQEFSGNLRGLMKRVGNNPEPTYSKADLNAIAGMVVRNGMKRMEASAPPAPGFFSGLGFKIFLAVAAGIGVGVITFFAFLNTPGKKPDVSIKAKVVVPVKSKEAKKIVKKKTAVPVQKEKCRTHALKFTDGRVFRGCVIIKQNIVIIKSGGGNVTAPINNVVEMDGKPFKK